MTADGGTIQRDFGSPPPRNPTRTRSPPVARRSSPGWLVVVLLVAATLVTATVLGFHMFTALRNPVQTFALHVDSAPQGLPFSIDGTSYKTPYASNVSQGFHTIRMRSYAVIETVTYNFRAWSDGERSSVRTIDLQMESRLFAEFGEPVSRFPVASDSYVGVLSMAIDGGHKFLADSRGKLIVVYVNGLGSVAVTVNNGDPVTDRWQLPFVSKPGFVRPAAILSTDDELHVLAESNGDVVDLVIHFARDAGGNITGGTFDPIVLVDEDGQYISAIRAHDGSLWAVWNHRDWVGSLFTASRLIVGHWTPTYGWEKETIAVDRINTERFYSIIIQRDDNYKIYVFANRGEDSVPRSLAFVSAGYSSDGWTWRPPNLTYETIASRGISDSVAAAWDPVHKLVVVVNDHSGTPSYFAFTLDSNDVKTHLDTPHFDIVNNDWGAILVDPVTGDYYLLFMEAVNSTGRLCSSRWSGSAWSDFNVIDENSEDISIQTRSGGGLERDFIFARGSVSGTVEIHYGQIL